MTTKTDTRHPARAGQAVQHGPRTWRDVAGGWLGIGTSPGALLIGAGLAARYGGPVPLLSILLSLGLMFALMWYQGKLGLQPPHGDGLNLTQVTPRYFGPGTQRLIGGVIAIGMIGWFGFNVGLGGAALGALLRLQPWLPSLLIGLPVLYLSLRGLRSWNGLASLATIAVLVLVLLVVLRLAARAWPVTLVLPQPLGVVTDVAVFIGYISVFSVRSPDFTAGLKSRQDLVISDLLLCLPVVLIALAGVGLQQGTGSVDLVGVLAAPGGLALGNLLVTVAVIAPTFTTLYSGAPAIKAALGIPERPAMVAITAIGLALAIARFDLWLLSWLSVLAAMLPPLVVPLAVESTLRRRGKPSQHIPVWAWLPGSLLSMVLTLLRHPLAPLSGLVLAGLMTGGWYYQTRRRA